MVIINTPARTPRDQKIIRLAASLIMLAVALLSHAPPAMAQNIFGIPWDEPEVRPAPRKQPRNNDWRPETRQQDDARNQGWTARNDICLRLEQSLVAQTQQGNQTRTIIPQLRADLRRNRQAWRRAEQELEQRDCFEYFLFSKSIRRTRRCIRLSNQAEEARRRVSRLEAELRQVESARGGNSRQDDIVRELARNNCGSQYTAAARRQNRNPLSALFGGGEQDRGSGFANNYNAMPFATYRTVCVRMCDGYYFPVSFSTLPNHFQRDADICRSKCAAPARLFYYQNPGQAVDEMVDAETNEAYNKLKIAFRYRKEYINGCSCKVTEYTPPNQTPRPDGTLPNPNAPPSLQEGAVDQPNAARRADVERNQLDPTR